VELLSDRDVEGLLDTVGEPVRVGGVQTVGLFRQGPADQLQGEVVAVGVTVTTLDVRTSKVPDVAIGTVVTARGRDWRVRSISTFGAGALTKLFLKEDDA
jgi:hypothetical protein